MLRGGRLLIAFSAGMDALLHRWLATLGGNPFIPPLCAATVGADAVRFHVSDAQSFIALCLGMVLVPGPHILNGAIDLARTLGGAAQFSLQLLGLAMGHVPACPGNSPPHSGMGGDRRVPLLGP